MRTTIGSGACRNFWKPPQTLLAVGVLAFAALMARLFPDEGPRVVHTAGDSFDVSFWRVVIRNQS